ncbi:hypothetical protein O181_064572 [Austropuccinia psidii MF-1]|uniref:Uncharacterized protein n=1 Tax=Austropuccinia psidii MF-1 TaxID=1389203 RepID=A0A9Q3ERT4_9BASI|nr:hypothetical protein [Austropuccinia psidii MF-1]
MSPLQSTKAYKTFRSPLAVVIWYILPNEKKKRVTKKAIQQPTRSKFPYQCLSKTTLNGLRCMKIMKSRPPFGGVS